MSVIIGSDKIEDIESILPSFKFTFNVNGFEQIVTDKDLNSEESALGYAMREFLLHGTNVQRVKVQTYSRGLQMNDIISIILPEYKIPIDLTKNRFIVTKVMTEYIGAKTLDTIEGVRYD